MPLPRFAIGDHARFKNDPGLMTAYGITAKNAGMEVEIIDVDSNGLTYEVTIVDPRYPGKNKTKVVADDMLEPLNAATTVPYGSAPMGPKKAGGWVPLKDIPPVSFSDPENDGFDEYYD